MTDSVRAQELGLKTKTNGDRRGKESHDEHAPPQLKPEQAEERGPAPAEPRRRPWAWALMGAAAVAAIGAGIAYYIHSLSFESTDDAFIDGHVLPVSSRVSGHVAQVYVDDNQLVKKDDLLVELDPADFQTRLAVAQAALKTAEATRSARVTGVEAAEADWEQSKSELVAAEARQQRANTHLKRIGSLVPEHAASQDSLEEASAAARVARADASAVREKINAKQSAVAQARSAATAAESAVHQAEAEVEQATLNCSYTKIRAPIAGHVTHKSVEKGAYVQVGQPLLALVDPAVWVTANFKETQLAKMEPGQSVIVTVDAHPDVTFAARVDSIQRGSGAHFSLLPPENATGNYVKVVQRVPVKIVFDDLKQVERYALGPGMSVVPTVTVDQSGRPSAAVPGVAASR